MDEKQEATIHLKESLLQSKEWGTPQTAVDKVEATAIVFQAPLLYE